MVTTGTKEAEDTKSEDKGDSHEKVPKRLEILSRGPRNGHDRGGRHEGVKHLEVRSVGDQARGGREPRNGDVTTLRGAQPLARQTYSVGRVREFQNQVKPI